MCDQKFYFLKGSENVVLGGDTDKIKEAFSKVIDGKNLSFLLGSGCSSFISEGTELGIPTMKLLAEEYLNFDNINKHELVLNVEEKERLLKDYYIDVRKDNYKQNLEVFLGTLYSLDYFFSSINYGLEGIEESHKKLKEFIDKTKNFILVKMLNSQNRSEKKDEVLLGLYQSFYRKLLFRNSNLAKTNIFTTNYDLYSETALDNLGIHYANGFSGGINKYFNPTIFNYALSEKMDLSQSKWNVIDNFIYLYKLHGSINWVEDSTGSKLFRVREIQETSYKNLKNYENIMIHPTPLKQNASLGSPYSDLFREFQKKIMQNNNVLVTIGYSFSDEHINNIVYQAFTIPSFRLIIMGDPNLSKEMEKIKSLDDPRVWFIYGELKDKSKVHYFKGFLDHVLPDVSNDDLDSKIENALKVLLNRK